MTFDEAFREFCLTPEERAELVFRLSAIRAERLVRTLLLQPQFRVYAPTEVDECDEA